MAAQARGRPGVSGALRRNPAARHASVRTVGNYRDCLVQVASRIADDGLELRDLTPESATAYLRTRTAELGQKALDMHRQALQAMLVHVSRRPPPGGRLEVVRSARPQRRTGRAYTPVQVRMVAARQTARNALATGIAHAAGLRAHELLTLARPGEQPPDPRPARAEKFLGRPGRDYTVVGKGGLVRLVRIPRDLADRLEARRRDQPVRVTDRGVHYRSRYDVGGGQPWSRSFSAASRHALGWSTGAHGLRPARPGEDARTPARPAPRRRPRDRQPGARPLPARHHPGLPPVKRRHLRIPREKVAYLVDELMDDTRGYEPDDPHRAEAIPDLLHETRRLRSENAELRADRKTADDYHEAVRAREKAVRDREQADRDRDDALRSRDPTLRALDAERAAHRKTRVKLNPGFLDRLKSSRNRLRRRLAYAAEALSIALEAIDFLRESDPETADAAERAIVKALTRDSDAARLAKKIGVDFPVIDPILDLYSRRSSSQKTEIDSTS